MSYTVLARKYRSKTFDEVVGQGPIATTLVNAIKAGRIHHGYLFTGTRGVGKTSMARILAKALNCLKFDAPTATPCGECDSCRAIAEGQDIDVVEIDAASNTGVDNIRELRANTAFRPARSRFKIYIIDEVHMLSTGAFNALLKTLEEPPGHVKFILATTEFQKVPATIRSRCQCFNFRNIGPDDIAASLDAVVKSEGATADPAVIRRVARLANGSMRDGLSILDQLLAVSSKKLSADVLDELLPPAQNERILAMLSHAADGDAAAVLRGVDETLNQGRGFEVFCNDAIEVARALLLIRTCGADTNIADVPAAARDEYARLAVRFDVSHYVQMIAMLEELRRNVRFSSAGRALVDAVAVRIANLRAWSSIEQVLASLPAGGAVAAASAGGDQKKKSLALPAGVAKPALAACNPNPPREQGSPDYLSPTRERGSDGTDAHAVHADAEPVRSGTAPLDSAQFGDRPADLIDGDADVDVQVSPRSYERASDAAAVVVAAAELSAAAVAGGPAQGLTADERERILRDPVVKQALDLFDGVVVQMQRVSPPAAPATAE